MRRLIEFFVQQTVFGDLLTVFILVIGLISLNTIRKEAFPNIAFDIITVTTIWPGAAAEEVERLVTNPIERDLKEVDGIKTLSSVSAEGRSYIVAELDPDQTTASEAKEDIQDVVDRQQDLPEDAEDPQVIEIESKLTPIIEVHLAGDIPEADLRAAAKTLEDEIESIPQVARVVFNGLRDPEIMVEPSMEKLSRNYLSLNDLVTALRLQNVSIPGGNIEAELTDPGSQERIVRTIGEFEDAEDVRNTVVRSNELGAPIRVEDVAKVTAGFEKATILSRTGGKRSIALTVLKKERADAVDLVDEVQKRIKDVKETLDPGVDITYLNDTSYFIRRRLGILSGNMVVGLFLVVVILSLILPLRVALLVSLGIPFGFLGTIALFEYLGISLHLISMIGLIIVLGMLVDDAIVVTENSVRLMEEGMEPREAAIKGAQQVWAPITASVLTTIVAFAPMMFMSGIFGKFVRFIPMGVILALIISLFEAFLILPQHIARIVRPSRGHEVKRRGPLRRILGKTEHFWDEKVTPAYVSLLKKFIRRRYWVMLGTGLLLIGSVALAVKGMRFVLFPPEGIEVFFIKAQAPVGTSLEKMQELMKPIERQVATLPPEELDNFNTSVGIHQQNPNDPTTRRGSEVAQIAIFLTPETERDRTAAEIIAAMRKQIVKPKGLDELTFERVNPGPPVGKPVSVGVRAREYSWILPVVEELKERLGTVEGVTDIRDNYFPGKEEFRVKVNSAEAAAAGLSAADIGTTVRAAYEGLVATSIQKLDEEIDIRVRLPESARATAETLESLRIPNARGNLIPLREVARIERARGVTDYQHEDNQRQVRVTADVNVDRISAVEANARVRDWVPELQSKYPNVNFDFGGEEEDTQESLQSLLRAFIIAAFGIFLILVMLFKQLFQPLLVMLTIPLGVISVVLAFFLHGMPLSFMGMLAIVALAGVIVNNAIVFMDFVNQFRAGGMDKHESILKAAEVRIRPIFLTTLTTVCGVLPTAYGIGGLDQFVVPIALGLGWGLLVGSVLTSLTLPPALAVLDDVQGWFHRMGAKLMRRFSQATR